MKTRVMVLLLSVVTIAWGGAGVGAAPPTIRSYSAGNFLLELNGQQVGTVTGVEGGLPFSDVVKETIGPDFFFKKHLASPGIRDIRLELGAGMDPSVYAWIGGTLQGQPLRMNGALLTVDLQGTVRSRLEFQQAQITEVTFPAAEGGSKEPVKLQIAITPAQTSLSKSGGSAKGGGKTAIKKAALGGNFRLSIDGLNMTKVSKVDAITVKIPLMGFGGGDAECIRCVGGDITPSAPAKIDVSDVVITLAEVGSESLYDWFEDFLIEGNNGDSQEKSGALEFLAPDLKSTVFTITFKHLGVFELAPVVAEAGQNTIARVMAALYCESVEFTAP